MKTRENDENALLKALLLTCKFICRRKRIEFKKSINLFNFSDIRLQDCINVDDYFFKCLTKISQVSEFNIRKIYLAEDWWKKDSGILLGFLNAEGCKKTPIMFVPKYAGYYMIDLQEKVYKKIKKVDQSLLSRTAYVFYPSPQIKIRSLKDILPYLFQDTKKNFYNLFVFQIFMVCFGFFIPISFGFIIDSIIPNSDLINLLQIGIALSINLVVISIFNLTYLITLIRSRFIFGRNLQNLMWDRLLKLPMNFFNKFTTGNLMFRVSSAYKIQEILTDSALLVVIHGLVSMLALILMLYYDFTLTIVVVILVGIFSVFTLMIDLLRLRYERRIFKKMARLTSLMSQLITGIAKLRIANAQNRFFNIWKRAFFKKVYIEYMADNLLIKLDSFNSILSIFATVAIYSLVIMKGNKLALGDFIVFNTAFFQFLFSSLSASKVVSKFFEIIPCYENFKPILLAEPEKKKDEYLPDNFTGEIKVRHLMFYYGTEKNIIFKDLNLDIRKGQTVALVGPSGAGKSTIFRLLLGFEKAQRGKIYYDNIDSSNLNMCGLRNKIGVVLQNNPLIPGTIYENIICNSNNLKREDILKLINRIGVGDFIAQLPMGLDTLISEGVTTFSGGQAQLIVLIRALAKKPNILFLDESTSALDNRTQKLITQFLANLGITQLISAHRLSTVMDADYIYVIDNGCAVQEGNYSTLIKEEGLFKSLSMRQLI